MRNAGGFILAVLVFTIYAGRAVYAHPGNTASDGCHYCRTNCDRWGEVWNARHCHGGGSSYTSTFTAPTYTPPPKPTCGANAYLDANDNCWCSSGYTPAVNGIDCVYLPSNAHSVTSSTDAWECDYGYEEINGACSKVEKEPATPTAPLVPLQQFEIEDTVVDEAGWLIRFLNFLFGQ